MQASARFTRVWARQFTIENGDELVTWAGPGKATWSRIPEVLGVLGQNKESGGHLVNGDWLLKTEDGEVRGMARAVFEEFYRETDHAA